MTEEEHSQAIMALHQHIAGIVPTVVSVWMPNVEDRSTWIVECEPPATPEQQALIDESIQGYALE